MDKDLRIGCFRVVSDLKSGVGSQGAVYKAVCERDGFAGVSVGTIVALKVMPVHDTGKSLFRRLKERTDELLRINHPNVVRYLGCFRESTPFNDVHVVVLEYLEGESLKDLLLRFPCGLDVDEALRIGQGALAGLTHICSLGMVHRDIKPGNIFLCADGCVKLIDFEVSRQDNNAATTTGGNLIGTFDYMAPDFTNPDFRGDEISDVFSFGVCLHEMLTGRTPYRRQPGDDSQASFAFLSRWSHAEESVSPIKISGRVNKVLSGAAEMLAKALQEKRSDRVQAFSELAEYFRQIRYRELSHGNDTWRLLLYVGRGGFGEVFKARDVRSGQLVAIKHLLKSGYADRFRREAKVMSKLSDSCFVRLHSFFELAIGGANSAFIVMEYLDGMPGLSLRDEIKRSSGDPLSREKVIAAFVRYAHGLAMLHSKGLFHRDIKPSNLYFPIDRISKAAIMDFGIARDSSGTETIGNVPGTLDYMPPEVAVEGSRGDSGMDVYALGLALYEALSGKMAYPRLPDGAAGYRIFFERAQSKTPPKLDSSAYCDMPGLVKLVEGMTEPDPERRIKDAAMVEQRLSSLLEDWRRQSEERQSEGFLGGMDDAEDGSMANEPETSATVAPDVDVLAKLKRDAAKERRKSGRDACATALLAVFIISVTGWFVYRHIEQKKAVAAELQRREAMRIEEEKRIAEENARREAEELRKAQAVREAEEKRIQEERRLKAEAQQKALEDALRRMEAERKAREEAERKIEAERKAEEERKAAEMARLAAEKERLRQEAERLAREKAEREAEEARKAAEEARLKAEREEKERAKVEEEAKRKAKEESERKAAEAAKSKAQTTAVGKADEAARKRELAKAEARRKLAELKAELDAYKIEYECKRAAALKPGARENPNDLDREWYLRLKKYRQFKKRIEALDK